MDFGHPATVLELLEDASLSLSMGQWKHVYGALVAWARARAAEGSLDVVVIVTLEAVEQLLKRSNVDPPPSGWFFDSLTMRKAATAAMAAWNAARIDAARSRH